MDLEVFRRMVMAAMVAVTPGAAVDVDVDDAGDGQGIAHVSITVRRAGMTTHGDFDVALPLDGATAIDAMNNVVRSVLELGA